MKKITVNCLEDFEDDNFDKPDIRAEAKLVSYSSTSEVTAAVDAFVGKVREAISVSQADWPKGRTLEYSVEFVVVPKLLRGKFGQE